MVAHAEQSMCRSKSMRWTKSAFADPRMWSYLSETHFLIRLRGRFYDVPIKPRGYQAGDLRMS